MDEVMRAIDDLVKLGLVEDSGQRCPDESGTMQVMWRVTPYGEAVCDSKREGLTLQHVAQTEGTRAS